MAFSFNVAVCLTLSLSASDSRVIASLYRLIVSLVHRPGVYYPTFVRERTNDECDIINTIPAHFAPSHTVSDIAEPPGSNLLSRFPKSGVRIAFIPDIRHKLPVHVLESVDCRFSVPNIQYQTRYRMSPQNHQVSTSGLLPTQKGPTTKPAEITLLTKELTTSRIRDHVIDSEQKGRRCLRKPSNKVKSAFGRAHSTLNVHQEVIRAATAYQSKLEENAGLRVAQLAFEIADNDKRLEVGNVGLNRTSKQETTKSCGINFSRVQYESSRRSMSNESLQSGRQTAYLALGSNIGDRVSMIETACREMKDRGLEIAKTSALYETKAMYLEDQQSFINGACEVSRIQFSS